MPSGAPGATARAAASLPTARPSASPAATPRVIEIATGEELGTFDSVADIALCLAFAKLGRDQVEIVTDASPMSSLTSWT